MEWTDLTTLDLLFATIILISAVFALFKGFVREIISLVALFAGLLLAASYYPSAARLLLDFSRDETVASLVGFLAIFLGCLLTGILVASLAKRFVKAASLQWIDHLLGGIFGLLRGWAVASIIVLALIAFPVRENILERSALAPYLLTGARAAALLVPPELKLQFYEHYKKVLQAWNESRSPA